MIDLNYLRKRATNIIDNEWKYSWHWGKCPNDRHWTMDAKYDCITRITEVEKELVELKKIKQELEQVAPLYIPNKMYSDPE
jgi:hypothetical protein